MDTNFLIAYKDTIGDEGLLSNDPTDRGGLTWKGISYTMHPEWAGWFSVKRHIANKDSVTVMVKDAILESLVQDFYYKQFWLKLRLNEIKDSNISIKFFNAAVNVGCSAATKFQQASVDLDQTGKIDDKLINALNS